MASSCLTPSSFAQPPEKYINRYFCSNTLPMKYHCRKNHFSPILARKEARFMCCLKSSSNGNGRVVSDTAAAAAVATDPSVFANGSVQQRNFGALDFISCKDTSNGVKASTHEGVGIGIVRFLKGKRVLITGATGFLAKVLIEKILRTAPEIGKIYVLIKAKNTEEALNRLKSEIINTELFRCLQEMHGKDYQSFMLRKIIPVAGNLRETHSIGIEANLADEMRKEVDIIINSAANTTFDERYDVAMDINTIGAWRLMSFAKTFQKLKLFLHVSTAYVNGQRQGRIMEKPFSMGETIATEMTSKASTKPTPILDIEAEIKLAFASQRSSSHTSWVQEMKELGLERAKIHGWQDTYVFTKAMGEMVLNSMRGDIPVVTIRPSVIESTYKEPFPGWMEGNRMMDPIVLQYGKGTLIGFPANANGILDVVPADMVVNAMLAAMAKHGSRGDQGMHIYHVASSVMNPLVFNDLARFIFQHFSSSPCIDSSRKPIVVPPIQFFNNIDEYSSHIWMDAIEKSGNLVGVTSHENLPKRLKNMLMKTMEQAKYLANIYEPYTFYKGRFDNTNTQNLMREMSEEEISNFNFNIASINWKEYISEVHVPGLRKYVMKERESQLKSALVGAGATA